MINNTTLDKLLTKLSEDVEFPSDDREVLRAVSTVGKNDTTTGEPVWCLNKLVTLDKFGTLIDNADFNLEWVSHLTEGDGHNIAQENLACKVEPELTSAYFDAMCHFLAGTLQCQCTNDVDMKRLVEELFDDPTLFYDSDESNSASSSDEEGEATKMSSCSTQTGAERRNFLSQFFLSSMGVIIGNYSEVKCYLASSHLLLNVFVAVVQGLGVRVCPHSFKYIIQIF